jgi:hypothetical protein
MPKVLADMRSTLYINSIPIADDGVVSLIDKNEKEWLLPSFMAKILLWFRTDKFSVMLLSYAKDFSTMFSTIFFVLYLFLVLKVIYD